MSDTNELTTLNTPDPTELLSLAAIETPHWTYRCASDYNSTIEMLREHKGFSWAEVREWFASQGLPFTLSALQSAYQKYRTR